MTLWTGPRSLRLPAPVLCDVMDLDLPDVATGCMFVIARSQFKVDKFLEFMRIIALYKAVNPTVDLTV